MQKCRHCGAYIHIDKDTRICPYCGQEVERDEDAQQYALRGGRKLAMLALRRAAYGQEPTSPSTSIIVGSLLVAMIILTLFLALSGVLPPPVLSAHSGPSLTVNTPLLNFGELEQGKKAMLSVVVKDSGTKPLSWIASTGGASWLRLETSEGTLQPGNQQPIHVVTDTSYLKIGNYSTILSIRSNDDHAQTEVKVRVIPSNSLPPYPTPTPTSSPTPTLSPTSSPTPTPTPSPCIHVDSQSLSFTMFYNQGDPAPQLLTITNCGGAGNWEASPSSSGNGGPWLNVRSSTGRLGEGASQIVTVVVSNLDCDGDSCLNHGIYQGSIIFTMGSSSVNVDVTLYVYYPPCIRPNQSSLRFTYEEGQAFDGPLSQSITIENCGEAGNWSAVVDNGSSWLSIDHSSGYLDGETGDPVTITVSTGLLAGTYTGHITFTIATSVGSYSTGVDVTVKVDPPPR